MKRDLGNVKCIFHLFQGPSTVYRNQCVKHLKIFTIKTSSEKDPGTDVTPHTHTLAAAGGDESQPKNLLNTGGVLSTLSDHGVSLPCLHAHGHF